MTYQQAIEQTKTLTREEQQRLAYYILFASLEKGKRDSILQSFNYKNDNTVFIEDNNNKQDKIANAINKFKGSVKGVWNNEDAQIYVNNLRKDDREF